MEEKKNRPKLHTVLFIVLFLAMLIVPALMLDATEPLLSDLENRAMTVWPGLGFDKAHMDWYGHYAEDRVGFRQQAIAANNYLNFHLFREFDEDIHMYGKSGHIFPSDSGYIRNYQHLDQPTELIDNLTGFLARTDAYAAGRGADFYVLVCPNKSSVYGNYMPDTIHVNDAAPSLLDLVKERFSAADIRYVIPDEEFRKRAKTEQIYNVAYDCAHWNDLGARYGLSLLDEKIACDRPQIVPMDESALRVSYVEKQLDFFSEPYPEEVPVAEIMVSAERLETSAVPVTTRPETPMTCYYNPDATTDATLLLLHDSFMDGRENWYYGRYQRVYSCSRNNYENMREYIDVLQPDVIIFEIAERAFMDDLHAYTALADITYPQ